MRDRNNEKAIKKDKEPVEKNWLSNHKREIGIGIGVFATAPIVIGIGVGVVAALALTNANGGDSDDTDDSDDNGLVGAISNGIDFIGRCSNGNNTDKEYKTTYKCTRLDECVTEEPAKSNDKMNGKKNSKDSSENNYGRVFYVTNDKKSGGNQKYYNTFYYDGDTVTKTRCSRSKFFDGKENEWVDTERKIDSWKKSDANMPEWIHEYIDR